MSYIMIKFSGEWAVWDGPYNTAAEAYRAYWFHRERISWPLKITTLVGE